MLKKYLVGAIALATLSFASSALAAVNAEQALQIARKEVPAESVVFGLKEDGPKFVVNFRDNALFRDYDVDVAVADGKVLALEIKGSNFVGSTMCTKTEADVKNAILAAYPDAKDIAVSFNQQGENNKVYTATFNTAKFSSVDVEVSPVTCALGKCKMIYR